MTAARAGKRVLVVEDDQDLRALVVRLLADQGCDVSEAGDGGQAIELVHARPPDLLLLDLMLPGVDGWAVLAALRSFEHRPPVVVMSARTEYEAYLQAAREGVAAYIEKPFSIRGLVATCLEVLADANAASQEDRRDATRHILRVPAQVLFDEGGGQTPGELMNLSTTGARIAVATPLPRDGGLRLAFEAPEGAALTLHTLVRWRSPVSRGFTYGLSFVDLDPEDRSRLLRLAPPSLPS